MSVRRNTTNRLSLIRSCGICGKSFLTTADTPFVRLIRQPDGSMKTTYFCSEAHKAASYKHKFDGKAEQRRKEREAKRDRHLQNVRYYAANAEKMRQRRRDAYWADPEAGREESRYYRRKRALKKSEKLKGESA